MFLPQHAGWTVSAVSGVRRWRRSKPFGRLTLRALSPILGAAQEEASMSPEDQQPTGDDRRDFLKKCGKFAALTPPAVSFLLSTSMSSKAIAASSGKPGNGFGDKNHVHSGPPGKLK